MLVVCIVCSNAKSQVSDSLIQRIFLVGDAGNLNAANKIPVLDWLKKNVDWNDERNVFIFLGDNIYPDGLPSPGHPEYTEAKYALDYQINLIRGTKAKGFFVPGNHDWQGGKKGGWQRVMNQVNYIQSLQQPNIQAWPMNGCPGPVAVELNEKVVVVFADSQWFLNIHEKPGPESECTARTLDEFTAELKQIAATHPNQLLLLAMHHPMYTYGLHGGAYNLKSHIFPLTEGIKGLYIPLPVLGSVYPIARGVFGNIQDTYHPVYKTMINEIEEVLKTHPNPMQAGGHEHSLQLIMKDSIPYIVSGSASKLTRLRKGRNSLYSTLEYGFATLEVRKSGNTETKYYTLRSSDMNSPVYTRQLKTITSSSPKPLIDTTQALPSFVEMAADATVKDNGWKRFFFGKNYRPEWKQPLQIPVLDLGKEFGGLKPIRQSGGMQSRALYLEDKTGKTWTLQSIEAFPLTVIPSSLRPVSGKTSLDAVSGTYPYAVLSISPLARASGVTDISRKLVYVPDDPRLERFRVSFKNTVAVLEQREPWLLKTTNTTGELVGKMMKSSADEIDQHRVLKARLLDNFIMDFDRHDIQWEWAFYQNQNRKVYYPIPRHHEQAFFRNEGIIPRLTAQSWFIPEIQGFAAKAKNIKTFNKLSANFDRFFLNKLNEEEWKQHIDSFITSMTDKVIDSALAQQPGEIKPYAAGELVAIMKAKKKYFKADMLEYYRFISKTVSIAGTNERDLFEFSELADGKVKVTAYSMDSLGKLKHIFFERIFTSDVTREIRLYGLAGNDSFVISKNRTDIRLRIIGGDGDDHFINKSKDSRATVYDVSFEENKFSGNTFKNRTSSDPDVNLYNRYDYKYNSFNPGLILELNADDGLQIGFKSSAMFHGFRKEPFAMRHYIEGRYAMRTKAYYFKYSAEFTRLVGKSDLVIKAGFGEPLQATNFFGIGNKTTIDRQRPGGLKYYFARYDLGEASVSLRRHLQAWLQLTTGITYKYFATDLQDNKEKFVSSAISSADSISFYSRKAYLGPEILLDISSKNNPVLPTRGATINGYIRPLIGLNKYSSNTIQMGLDISIFMSLVPETKFVLGTRFGASHNIGKFEFPQAQYLSGTNNLRGYHRNRFAGRTVMFNNLELRYKLANFKTYLFQGAVGFFAFHDVGRVWAANEKSKKWHNGYGGGVWISPIKRFVLTGTLVFSKEETALPMIKFGFLF